jgi:hypothetical protein
MLVFAEKIDWFQEQKLAVQDFKDSVILGNHPKKYT